MRHRLLKMSLNCLLVAVAVMSAVPLVLADVEPPGEVRERLTFDEMMAGAPSEDGPIHNDYFMPVGAWEPAHHELSGILKVPVINVFAGDGRFPGFSAGFFTSNGYLIPDDRNIIDGRSQMWDVILSPGRVWSEPGDEGWSRASFPFVLIGKIWNESHNGLATFLYNDTKVSDLQVQIVQEAAWWARFDFWARLELKYRPGSIEGRAELEAAFFEELSQRLPTAPLDALDAERRLILGMENNLEHVTVTGLLVDGTLYRTSCYTRYGDYPYCDDMRHGVYPVTMSAAAALSLLWLAEKYGPDVLDFRIADYVHVTAHHDGWDNVTFRDAIDMATGVGTMANNRGVSDTYDFEDDDKHFIWRFANAVTVEDKMRVAFLPGNYLWGPGEVARYNTMHTFILSAAMDEFLKSQEGPDVNLRDRVTEEVLWPMGIRFAPLMHTQEWGGERGIPIMGWGFFPTVGDLAKIAQLYQDRGAFGGRQLLYADEIDMLLMGDPDRGLPINWFNGWGRYSYDFSFWYLPYRADGGCRIRIPEMMGVGNLVAFMPNGMTGIRLADSDPGAPRRSDGENMAALADGIRSFCD